MAGAGAFFLVRLQLLLFLTGLQYFIFRDPKYDCDHDHDRDSDSDSDSDYDYDCDYDYDLTMTVTMTMI